MALTRKLLSAMGIEDDKIEEIISAHTETVNALKQERDGFKEDAEKYEQATKDLKKANDKIAKLEESAKNKPTDEYKEKYETEHKAFEDYKADITAKETKAAKESAYKEICKDAKLSEEGIAKAMKYADWDKIELGDDGKVKDSKEHLKAISEEWGKYIETPGRRGSQVETPPANNGGGQTEESYAARRIREQREQIYGKAKEE